MIIIRKICDKCGVKLDIIMGYKTDNDWDHNKPMWAHFGNGDDIVKAIEIHGKYERYPLSSEELDEFNSKKV